MNLSLTIEQHTYNPVLFNITISETAVWEAKRHFDQQQDDDDHEPWKGIPAPKRLTTYDEALSLLKIMEECLIEAAIEALERQDIGAWLAQRPGIAKQLSGEVATDQGQVFVIITVEFTNKQSAMEFKLKFK